MPRELDARLETLQYRARYAKPLLNLWGNGPKIIGGLYAALHPYGVTTENMDIHPTTTAASVLVTSKIPPNSTIKFAYDRIEFEFNGFTVEFFDKIPTLFGDCVTWLRTVATDLKFASHYFGYFCHAFIKDSTVKDFLNTVNPRALRSSAGISLGNGAIFHSFLPEKDWTVNVWFDNSTVIRGALFIGITIEVATEFLDYIRMLQEGRSYFAAVLSEFDLVLPETIK